MRIKHFAKWLVYKVSLIGRGGIILGANFWKGGNVQIYARDANIIFGQSCAIRSQSSIVAEKNARIRIGDNVFFNRNCTVCAKTEIVIDDNCIFGPNVCIYDHNHVYDYNGVMPNEYRTGEIHIEKNCWIGANVVILKGVTIGECSIIGAGAIVRRDIPAHSLVIDEHTIKSVAYEKEELKQ